MGGFIRKLTFWVRLAIASETSGDIAWVLVVVLWTICAVEFVWERIL
jgi:hypothetical protein